MQTLTEIKEMLAARGLAPRKSFGQNFLVDQNLIRKLVDESGVREGDLVLEIGPGTGTLTEELLDRGCRVIAAEIDRGLCELLRERFASRGERFRLVEGDCLESKRALSPAIVAAIGGERFTLVANLPYGAATPVMMILLADYPACRGLFVTIQKEVAERMLAGPGGRDYGPLAVLVHVTAEAKLIATLPSACFWPRPEVTSAMVAAIRRPAPLADRPGALADFCQRLFEQRRKQLGAVLGREGEWPASIAPNARAEALSPEQLMALWRARRP